MVPASALNPIIKPWPFRGWGIDLIGQINPPSSKGHKLVLLATDYFRDNLNHAIMILLNWRYAILTHMSVTMVAPTCQ
jgi:hypothetical protein